MKRLFSMLNMCGVLLTCLTSTIINKYGCKDVINWLLNLLKDHVYTKKKIK